MVLLKDLKVAELKEQLEERELEVSGTKSVLAKRLKDALTNEGQDPETFEFEVGGITQLQKQLGNIQMQMLENSANLETKMFEQIDCMRAQVLESSTKLEKKMEESVEHLEQEQQELVEKLLALERELELMKNKNVNPGNRINNQVNLKPPEFDGKGSWKNYHVQFEAAAVANHWTTEEKATALTLSLRGDAANILQSLPPEDLHEYDKLVKCLETRFGLEHLQGLYHCQLKGRQQRPKESLQEYELDIVRLTRLAYPDTPEKVLECLAVQAFADGLRDEDVKQAVLLSRSKTITAALSCALEFEAVKANSRNTAKVREVEALTENQETNYLRKLVEEIISGKQMPIRKSVQCWNCGKKGHVRRQCKVKEADTDRPQQSEN